MFLWPHVLCSLAAIWLLVRWHQGDGRGWVNASGIVAVTVVALLWHERAVLIPPLVFGVAVALADEAGGWRRLTATVRRYRWLWLSMLATAVGFLVLHGLLTDDLGNRLYDHQATYARPAAEVRRWKNDGSGNTISLAEVVRQVRPTMLIGTAGAAGAW